MEIIRINVDFSNCDHEGLNTIGAMQSLNLSQVVLRNGLEVELECSHFFSVQGMVEYSASEHIWVSLRVRARSIKVFLSWSKPLSGIRT
jgi:hypothetical protein